MRQADITSAILITLAAALVTVLAGSSLSFLRVSENWIHDLRIATLTPPTAIHDEIVLITITEETLSQFEYRSPVDREFLSHVLRQLAAKGVQTIGLDILFDQATEPHKDALLQKTITDLGIPIVVAWAGADDQLSEPQQAFLNKFTAAMTLGHTRVQEDADDGKVRAIVLGSAGDGASPPALVSKLATLRNTSLTHKHTLALDFRLGPDAQTSAFATYPAHTLKFLPRKWLAGKVVLVGADLPHSDRHHTPLSLGAGKTLPGVELHAQAYAQLLEARQAPIAQWTLTLIVVVLLAGAAVALAAKVEPYAPRFVGGIAIIVLTWVVAFIVYRQLHISVPLAMPTLAFIIASGLAHAYFRRRERAARQFIRGAFEKFMAPAYIDQLIENPSLLNPNGEERIVTSLFTDIAGFTRLVDTLPPPVLVKALNEYLDQSSILVMEHGGTIDKVMGDALHVMYNAPLKQPDHAERAVQCALALDQFSDNFILQKKREGIDFGHTRIGVNTGPATVGNFGGSARFDYTAHGTTINMAARLESANKHFGTRICVSATVRKLCPTLSFRAIGDVVLIGLSKPETLYEVLSAEDAASDRVLAYEKAYLLLQQGDPSAGEEFAHLLERYPDDNLIRYQTQRLQFEDSGTLIVLKDK